MYHTKLTLTINRLPHQEVWNGRVLVKYFNLLLNIKNCNVILNKLLKYRRCSISNTIPSSAPAKICGTAHHSCCVYSICETFSVKGQAKGFFGLKVLRFEVCHKLFFLHQRDNFLTSLYENEFLQNRDEALCIVYRGRTESHK